MAQVLLFHHAQGLTSGVHEFADSSLASYDEGAAALLTKRVVGFLEDVG